MAQAPQRLLALSLRALCRSSSSSSSGFSKEAPLLLALEQGTAALARGGRTFSSRSTCWMMPSTASTATTATMSLRSHRLASSSFCLTALRHVSSTSKVGPHCSRKAARRRKVVGKRGEANAMVAFFFFFFSEGARERASEGDDGGRGTFFSLTSTFPLSFSLSLSLSLPPTKKTTTTALRSSATSPFFFLLS